MKLQGWQAPDRGVLFVVSGASGTGKTTLLRAAFDRVPGLAFSVSATTRAPRHGERDGVDYHFVDNDRFSALLAGNELLEHAEVYGTRYGTPRAPVMEALRQGRSIVLDIDVQGARQVRRVFADASPDDRPVSIFVLPPRIDDIRQRLVARGTDRLEVIERRVREAKEQISACGDYDYIVMNDVLDTAHAQMQGIFVAELSRRSRRESWVRSLTGGPDGHTGT
jgi:guanylate kinase